MLMLLESYSKWQHVIVSHVGVGVYSKHFYYYLFSSRWEFMSKIIDGQL